MVRTNLKPLIKKSSIYTFTFCSRIRLFALIRGIHTGFYIIRYLIARKQVSSGLARKSSTKRERNTKEEIQRHDSREGRAQSIGKVRGTLTAQYLHPNTYSDTMDNFFSSRMFALPSRRAQKMKARSFPWYPTVSFRETIATIATIKHFFSHFLV